MILCTVSDFERYAGLHPLFPAVAEFLARPDLRALPEGKLELRGEDLYVSCSPHARTRPPEEALLEAHRAYIDVQLVLEGTDLMGWAPLADCQDETVPYDEAKDIRFFRDAPRTHVQVGAGQAAVFFPEDAHAPLIGAGGCVHKLVVKVKVASPP